KFNHSTITPVDTYTSTGIVTVLVKQRINGSQWFDLGQFEFDPAVGAKIVVRNDGTDGVLAADASRFTPVGTSTPTLPAAPTGISATATGSTSIAINWTDNANNETGYLLQRSVNGGDNWTDIPLGANTTSYTDNGRTPETAHL